jgi:phosphoribosylamine-glycine ligase
MALDINTCPFSMKMLLQVVIIKVGEAQFPINCQSRRNCSANMQDGKKAEYPYHRNHTEADAASAHVAAADEAILLSGPESKAYLDGEQIIKIATSRKVDVIIPGYGFLSENAEFSRQVSAAGMVFAGPSPESMESFGIKHTARDLAVKVGVPIVPGTKGLVNSEDEAVQEATQLGYPVMLKATAGGGGMGLLTCTSKQEVRESFRTVQSRGETLFKNSGLFIERYYPSVDISRSRFLATVKAKPSISAKGSVRLKGDTKRFWKSAPVLLWKIISVWEKS